MVIKLLFSLNICFLWYITATILKACTNSLIRCGLINLDECLKTYIDLWIDVQQCTSLIKISLNKKHKILWKKINKSGFLHHRKGFMCKPGFIYVKVLPLTEGLRGVIFNSGPDRDDGQSYWYSLNLKDRLSLEGKTAFSAILKCRITFWARARLLSLFTVPASARLY